MEAYEKQTNAQCDWTETKNLVLQRKKGNWFVRAPSSGQMSQCLSQHEGHGGLSEVLV